MPPSSSEQPFIQRMARRLFGERLAAPDALGAAPELTAADPGTEQSATLFDDWKLPLTPTLQKRIKADVAQRLPATAQPSAAQWRMILSRTPATQVVAGAGAGKSTSLVLRLLVLHHYLGYDLGTTTVITFTRESRKDFIKKMKQLFDLWEINLSDQQAGEVVRTFHSRLLPLVRSLPGLADLRAFETLGAEASGSQGNPFDLRINDQQRGLLNQCYSALLTADGDFRLLIGALRLRAFALKRLDRDHPEVRKRVTVSGLAAQRDEELCDLIEDQWYHAGSWPIEGIEPQRKAVSINGSTFYCHGYIAELDAWVVLGVDPGSDPQMQRKGAKLPVRAEWAVKRTLFQAFCNKPLIWLDNYQDGQRLWGALANRSVAGPGFDYQVRGDLGSAPLLDAFVATAGFIENLGLDVSAAVAAMDHSVLGEDSEFFQALALFWPAFNEFLHRQQPPLMSYNSMFATLGEAAPGNLAQVPEALLRCMTHLMIDEFQDISPQIVGWVRACLAEVRRRATLADPQRPAATSLLCVGDDWQSIYGWRGSSPKFFMEFPKEFSSPSTTKVMLSDNFRSHQHIIDAAEHIVRAAPAISGKKARASGLEQELLPVTVLDRDDDRLVATLIEHYNAGDSVLLLYRKGSERSKLPEPLQALMHADYALAPHQRRLKQLTYHSSKGLQADAVFLLGDCQHLTRSPYKNQVYQLAGLGKEGDLEAFDTAQKDEVLRLAYVAITRAVRHCYWFIDAAGNEDASVAKASARIASDKAFFEDRRGVAVLDT